MISLRNTIIDKIFWWVLPKWRVRQSSHSLRSFKSWIDLDIKLAEQRERGLNGR